MVNVFANMAGSMQRPKRKCSPSSRESFRRLRVFYSNSLVPLYVAVSLLETSPVCVTGANITLHNLSCLVLLINRCVADLSISQRICPFELWARLVEKWCSHDWNRTWVCIDGWMYWHLVSTGVMIVSRGKACVSNIGWESLSPCTRDYGDGSSQR